MKGRQPVSPCTLLTRTLSWGSSGNIEEINGVKTYIALPSVEYAIDVLLLPIHSCSPRHRYPKDKAVLFLSDVFGLELVNNKVRFMFSLHQLKFHLPKSLQLLVRRFILHDDFELADSGHSNKGR